LAPVEPNLRSQDSELTAAGRELAEDLGTSDTDRFSSPAERRAAERTERRRQRTEVQGEAAGGRRSSTRSTRAPTPSWAWLVRDSLGTTLIAVIAGGILGGILSAVSAGGWVIGLLVAALTVVLMRVLGPHSRSTREGARWWMTKQFAKS
jgi:hypothetical protein